jgi:hypothetical protein
MAQLSQNISRIKKGLEALAKKLHGKIHAQDKGG